MTRFSSTGEKKIRKKNSVQFASTIEENDDTNNSTKINVDSVRRKQSIFTVEKLNERCNLNQDFDESTLGGTWNYIKKYYKPTPAFFKRQLFKRIPFLDWIRQYNVKEWLVSDIVSGLTIGIVHIPQGRKKIFSKKKIICFFLQDLDTRFLLVYHLLPVFMFHFFRLLSMLFLVHHDI